MRWIPDQTGQFRWRPYYLAVEIDRLCERRVRAFLRARHGAVAYPLATDDLTRLIEQEAGDLDLFADLEGRDEGGEVQGITTFVRGGRPRVQIARTLSERPARQARLRTTLAHELGHVLLHQEIIDRNSADDDWPPAEAPDPWPSSCIAEAGRGVPGADWLEWQAGYASGAILMPRMAVALAVRPVPRRAGRGELVAGRPMGRLIDIVQGRFLVSAAAASVRLRQLGYIHGRAPP